MLKKIFISIVLLSGCASLTVPPEYQYKEIETSYFKLASWQKITNPDAPYKIYIEGDGAAFRADGSVSFDPTPRSVMLREIAFGDRHPNIIYLARPCQFVKDKKCQPKYWSTARFSKESVQSEYEAVKSVAKSNPVTLVGFSGGAQIAGLMAVRYADLNVQKLVTVAGNLDVKSWTDYHNLPPLLLSDDLADRKNEYAKFNQVHYIGRRDDNIIPEITERFVANTSRLIYVENATHNSGWESEFQAIRDE